MSSKYEKYNILNSQRLTQNPSLTFIFNEEIKPTNLRFREVLLYKVFDLRISWKISNLRGKW